MFRRYRGGNFLLPFAHDRRGFDQDIGSLDGCHLAPDCKPPCCRLKGVVQVFFLGVGQLSDFLFRRRIQDWKSVGGLAPFSIDIEMQVWIGAHQIP